ncbi:PspC domain-containing protein [Tsukamurella sp. 8F]|uniref:PspC domain-containing protein n=1 Tax=unclassified Tsukamurella TaxID=2633480 RepID=UPI0023BA069D|nr:MULTISPECIES: PspC domain-containing protein [unclassified Tsukamurella]MDF0529101.1 PspC domain-containing protein [Tsukamurella sp. 8J]MDF0589024.1 PspC domain-containing protein [Tsukamurella sp. 8F]
MSNTYPNTGTPTPRRFTRDTSDRWLGGVCSGTARYFGVSPALVRVLAVVSILLPGPQFLLYILLWIIMPKD